MQGEKGNEKQSRREQQAFDSQCVLEGEVVIQRPRGEPAERKSDGLRNLFSATAKNSLRKGCMTERGRGRREERTA